MKKLLLLLVIFYGAFHYKDLMPQGILQLLVNNHTRALDCDNIYADSLNPFHVYAWQEAILEVKQFVLTHTKKQKKFLLNCFAEIYAENESLIRNIRHVYAASSEGVIKADLRRQFSKTFERSSKKMRRIEHGLYWVASNHAIETQAIEHVQKLAKYIAVTANKAHRNLSLLN